MLTSLFPSLNRDAETSCSLSFVYLHDIQSQEVPIVTDGPCPEVDLVDNQSLNSTTTTTDLVCAEMPTITSSSLETMFEKLDSSSAFPECTSPDTQAPDETSTQPIIPNTKQRLYWTPNPYNRTVYWMYTTTQDHVTAFRLWRSRIERRICLRQTYKRLVRLISSLDEFKPSSVRYKMTHAQPSTSKTTIASEAASTLAQKVLAEGLKDYNLTLKELTILASTLTSSIVSLSALGYDMAVTGPRTATVIALISSLANLGVVLGTLFSQTIADSFSKMTDVFVSEALTGKRTQLFGENDVIPEYHRKDMEAHFAKHVKYKSKYVIPEYHREDIEAHFPRNVRYKSKHSFKGIIGGFITLFLGVLVATNTTDVASIRDKTLLLRSGNEMSKIGHEIISDISHIFEDYIDAASVATMDTLINLSEEIHSLMAITNGEYLVRPEARKRLYAMPDKITSVFSRVESNSETSHNYKNVVSGITVLKNALVARILEIRNLEHPAFKPDPVPILFAGKKNCGKTTLNLYILPKLMKDLGLSTDLYDLAVTNGKYHGTYSNQWAAFRDELFYNSKKDKILEDFNALFSKNPFNCAGAAISEKHQYIHPLVVGFTSNSLTPSDTKITDVLSNTESVMAIYDRLIWIEVLDPEAPPEMNRTNAFQATHRKDDMSHLRFKIRRVESTSRLYQFANEPEEITFSELYPILLTQVRIRYINFLNDMLRTMPDNDTPIRRAIIEKKNELDAPEKILPEDMSIPQVVRSVNYKAAEGNRNFVIRFQGDIGTGKTTKVKEILPALEYYYQMNTIWNPAFTSKPLAEPAIYVLDDILTDANIPAYITWINNMNPTSIVIITTNTIITKFMPTLERIRNYMMGFKPDQLYWDFRHLPSSAHGYIRRSGCGGPYYTTTSGTISEIYDNTYTFNTLVHHRERTINRDEILDTIDANYRRYIDDLTCVQEVSGAPSAPLGELDFDLKIPTSKFSSLGDRDFLAQIYLRPTDEAYIKLAPNFKTKVRNLPYHMFSRLTYENRVSTFRDMIQFFTRYQPNFTARIQIGDEVYSFKDKIFYIATAFSPSCVEITIEPDNMLHIVSEIYDVNEHLPALDVMREVQVRGPTRYSIKLREAIRDWVLRQKDTNPHMFVIFESARIQRETFSDVKLRFLQFIHEHPYYALIACIVTAITTIILLTSLFSYFTSSAKEEEPEVTFKQEVDREGKTWIRLEKSKDGKNYVKYKKFSSHGEYADWVKKMRQDKHSNFYDHLYDTMDPDMQMVFNKEEGRFGLEYSDYYGGTVRIPDDPESYSNLGQKDSRAKYKSFTPSTTELDTIQSLYDSVKSVDMGVEFIHRTFSGNPHYSTFVKNNPCYSSNMKYKSLVGLEAIPTKTSQYTDVVSKITENMVLAHSIDGSQCRGIMIDGYKGVTLAHIFHKSPPSHITYVRKDKLQYSVPIRLLSIDKARDVALFEMDRSGSTAFPCITHLMKPTHDFRDLAYGTYIAMRTTGPITYAGNFYFSEFDATSGYDVTLPGFQHIRNKLLFTPKQFLQVDDIMVDGDCGNPVIGFNANNQPYFLGMVNATSSPVIFGTTLAQADFMRYKSAGPLEIETGMLATLTQDKNILTDGYYQRLIRDASMNAAPMPEGKYLKPIGYLSRFALPERGKELSVKLSDKNTINKNLCEFAPQSIKDVKDKSKLVKDLNGQYNILYTQIAKYESDAEWDVDEEILELAYSYVLRYYKEMYGKARPLTNEELLNGIKAVGDPCFGGVDTINFDSSPGPYYTDKYKVTKKKDFVEVIPGTEGNCRYRWNNKEWTKDLLLRMELNEKALLQGKIWRRGAKSCLKQETLPREKAERGGTRLFTCLDFDVLLVQRKYYAYANGLQKIHRHRAYAQTGFVAPRDMAIMKQRLLNIDGGTPDIEAGDFERFDKRHLKKFRELFNRMMWELYGSPTELKTLFETLSTWILELIQIGDGMIYRILSGMLSGEGATGDFNNFVLLLMLMSIVIKRMIEKDIGQKVDGKVIPTYQQLRSLFDAAGLGDDHLAAYAKRLGISFEYLKEQFQKFGHVLTPSDKADGTEKTFCSRLTTADETGILWPALKKITLMGMLFFVPKDHLCIPEAMNQLMFEAAMWDEDFYNTIISDIQTVLSEYRPYGPRALQSIHIPTYKVMRKTLIRFMREDGDFPDFSKIGTNIAERIILKDHFLIDPTQKHLHKCEKCELIFEHKHKKQEIYEPLLCSYCKPRNKQIVKYKMFATPSTSSIKDDTNPISLVKEFIDWRRTIKPLQQYTITNEAGFGPDNDKTWEATVTLDLILDDNSVQDLIGVACDKTKQKAKADAHKKIWDDIKIYFPDAMKQMRTAEMAATSNFTRQVSSLVKNFEDFALPTFTRFAAKYPSLPRHIAMLKYAHEQSPTGTDSFLDCLTVRLMDAPSGPHWNTFLLVYGHFFTEEELRPQPVKYKSNYASLTQEHIYKVDELIKGATGPVHFKIQETMASYAHGPYTCEMWKDDKSNHPIYEYECTYYGLFQCLREDCERHHIHKVEWEDYLFDLHNQVCESVVKHIRSTYVVPVKYKMDNKAPAQQQQTMPIVSGNTNETSAGMFELPVANAVTPGSQAVNLPNTPQVLASSSMSAQETSLGPLQGPPLMASFDMFTRQMVEMATAPLDVKKLEIASAPKGTIVAVIPYGITDWTNEFVKRWSANHGSYWGAQFYEFHAEAVPLLKGSVIIGITRRTPPTSQTTIEISQLQYIDWFVFHVNGNSTRRFYLNDARTTAFFRRMSAEPFQRPSTGEADRPAIVVAIHTPFENQFPEGTSLMTINVRSGAASTETPYPFMAWGPVTVTENMAQMAKFFPTSKREALTQSITSMDGRTIRDLCPNAASVPIHLIADGNIQVAGDRVRGYESKERWLSQDFNAGIRSVFIDSGTDYIFYPQNFIDARDLDAKIGYYYRTNIEFYDPVKWTKYTGFGKVFTIQTEWYDKTTNVFDIFEDMPISHVSRDDTIIPLTSEHIRFGQNYEDTTRTCEIQGRRTFYGQGWYLDVLKVAFEPLPPEAIGGSVNTVPGVLSLPVPDIFQDQFSINTGKHLNARVPETRLVLTPRTPTAILNPSSALGFASEFNTVEFADALDREYDARKVRTNEALDFDLVEPQTSFIVASCRYAAITTGGLLTRALYFRQLTNQVYLEANYYANDLLIVNLTVQPMNAELRPTPVMSWLSRSATNSVRQVKYKMGAAGSIVGGGAASGLGQGFMNHGMNSMNNAHASAMQAAYFDHKGSMLDKSHQYTMQQAQHIKQLDVQARSHLAPHRIQTPGLNDTMTAYAPKRVAHSGGMEAPIHRNPPPELSPSDFNPSRDNMTIQHVNESFA